MPCPTCDHTMHQTGCHQTGLPFFWCPRCGTVQTCEGNVCAPALVDRVKRFRDLAQEGQGLWPPDARLWHRLGVSECVSLPGNNRGDK